MYLICYFILTEIDCLLTFYQQYYEDTNYENSEVYEKLYVTY